MADRRYIPNMSEEGIHPQVAIVASRVRRLHALCRGQLFWQTWTSSLLAAMLAAGVAILAGRMLGVAIDWLWPLAALGLAVSLVVPVIRLWRDPLTREDVAAWLDCRASGGGLVMMALADPRLTGWEERLERVSLPRAHVRLWGGLLAFGAALCFPLLCGLVPLPEAEPAPFVPRLDISAPVSVLEEKLAILGESGLLAPERRDELSRALREIAANTAALQPGKVYESLDAMESALRQLGEDGARQLVGGARSLEEMELAMERLAVSPDEEAERRLRARAAQLGEMLGDAPALAGIGIRGGLSPEQAIADFLKTPPPASEEQLRRLAESLRQCRGTMGEMLRRLQEGDCASGMEALRARLDADGRLSATSGPGGEMWLTPAQQEALFGKENGGIGAITRGRGDAPMFFGSESPELGVTLTPERLSGEVLRMDLNEALGVSFAAPEVQAVDDGGQGALGTDAGEGGQSRRMRIPPADRELVRRFFAQDEE